MTNPGRRVTDWTDRVSAVLALDTDRVPPRLEQLPLRERAPLETDSSYAARCLKERLTALDAIVGSPAGDAQLTRWWNKRVR
jgi:hypothetical protein